MIAATYYHAIRGVLLTPHHVISINDLWEWMTTQCPQRFYGGRSSFLEYEVRSKGSISCLSCNDLGMVSFNLGSIRLVDNSLHEGWLRKSLSQEFPDVLLRMPLYILK